MSRFMKIASWSGSTALRLRSPPYTRSEKQSIERWYLRAPRKENACKSLVYVNFVRCSWRRHLRDRKEIFAFLVYKVGQILSGNASRIGRIDQLFVVDHLLPIARRKSAQGVEESALRVGNRLADLKS